MKPEEFNKRFQQEKARGFTYYDCIGSLEAGIRPLVEAAFKIPYVLPTSSCEGHLYTWEQEERLIKEIGKEFVQKLVSSPREARFKSGFLTLLFEHSKQADQLIEKIKALQDRFPFVKIWPALEKSPLSPIPLEKENASRLLFIEFREKSLTRLGALPKEEAQKYFEEQLALRNALLKLLKEESSKY